MGGRAVVLPVLLDEADIAMTSKRQHYGKSVMYSCNIGAMLRRVVYMLVMTRHVVRGAN